MSLLSEPDRDAVRQRLAVVQHPVTILFFTQTFGAPDSVRAARQIVDEVASLSERITVDEVNFVLEKERAAQYGIEDIPAIALLRNGEDTRIRFLGAPSGYEFMSLVEAADPGRDRRLRAVAGEPQGDRRAGGRADGAARLRDADVPALPARGDAGAPHGGGEPAHHARCASRPPSSSTSHGSTG